MNNSGMFLSGYSFPEENVLLEGKQLCKSCALCSRYLYSDIAVLVDGFTSFKFSTIPGDGLGVSEQALWMAGLLVDGYLWDGL